MREDFEDFFSDEPNDLVNRYEDMIKNKRQYFFDVYEFENIIDYYIEINKANNALNVVQFASKQHPGSIAIQLKKAQVFIDKGFAKQALRIIHGLEQIESTNPEIFLLKGTAFTMLKQYQEAMLAFDQAVENAFEEDKVDTLNTIAQDFEQFGKYTLALNYLHQALELDPSNIMFLYDIAYCYEKAGKIKDSLKFYHQYLDKEPFSENAWYNLGILYTKLDNYKEAIDAFEYAIAINPDFSLAYFSLANALSEDEQYYKAILNYQEFIEIDEDSPEVYTYIGNCWESLDQRELAMESYDKALGIDNKFPDAISGKASVMFQRKKYDIALKMILKALDIDHSNPDYHYLLGNIYSAQDKKNLALKAYQKAYELDSTERDFILALSDAYLYYKNYDKAIAILIQGIKDNKKSSILHYRLAGTYLLARKSKPAVQYFEKGLKLNPLYYFEIFTVCPKAIENSLINSLLNKYILSKKNS
ncbi:MAG: tetratricopeptide repeat protein [Bacteroidales bacterium]|jgi:tetratricopeptide (TPR) repeat protein|nr:tetratricopeptide repeat protein [Bacteroidales bacterium]